MGASSVKIWTGNGADAKGETQMCYALVDDLGGVVLDPRDG